MMNRGLNRGGDGCGVLNDDLYRKLKYPVKKQKYVTEHFISLRWEASL